MTQPGSEETEPSAPASPSGPNRGARRTVRHWLRHQLGRIRVRLLLAGWIIVVLPVSGLELARVYERQLLAALEREMTHQAVLVKETLRAQLAGDRKLGAVSLEPVLTRAAKQTRTRIRILLPTVGLAADSHRHGPPEGPEPAPPSLVGVGDSLRSDPSAAPDTSSLPSEREETADISKRPLLERPEVKAALKGKRGTYTRYSNHPPAVYFFVAEPMRHEGQTAAVVYVTRSTNPVLFELHRIRTGLVIVTGVALVLTAFVTLLLSLTISRPLTRLSRAAKRIAAGESNVAVPLGGGGELTELGHSLANMTEQLQQRLRYISDFAADVAHEFKSPLTSIRGAAELLTAGAADDPRARARFLRNIELDAHRLDRLVSRLLVLSRIEASQQELSVVDLRELTQRAVRRCQTPEGTVRLRYETPIAAIRARPADLETALLNLLDNALRHSPPGETVEVVVARSTVGRSVTISVCDRGSGISPELRDKVFQRFFTTDTDGEGTGLGLAIVKSVAEAHRGSVRVESEVGRGARFILELPVGIG